MALSEKTKLRLVALFVGAWMAWIMIGNAEAGQAAGCFIPLKEGVVLTLNHAGEIQLPMGSPNLNETGRETAGRETLEETGIEVNVGHTVWEWPNGNVLFLCMPKEPINFEALVPLPSPEVSRVIVLNPITMTDYHGMKVTNSWRFPDDVSLIRGAYRLWCIGYFPDWGDCWVDQNHGHTHPEEEKDENSTGS